MGHTTTLRRSGPKPAANPSPCIEYALCGTLMAMKAETYNEIMPFASVKKVAEADFPTRWGQFRILGFEGPVENPAACNDNIPAPRRPH